MDEPRDGEVEELLRMLNEWEQQYGTTYAGNPMLKGTGEANARIAGLKETLEARGVVYHWNGTEYVVDAVTAGRGRQGPDAAPTR